MSNNNIVFEESRNFVIYNLNKFVSNKVISKYIELIIDKLNRLVISETDGIKDIIMLLEESENSVLSKGNRGLRTLLFGLRKHLENNEYFTKIGVNGIFPELNYRGINKYDDLFAEYLNIEKNIKPHGLFDHFSHPVSTAFRTMLANLDTNYLDWTNDLAIVCVSGNVQSHGNVFGHTLLRLGDMGYLHINGLMSKPEFIPHFMFNKYLKKNHSFVVDVQKLPKNLDATTVIEKIGEYANKRWLWGIVHHNCLSFAREAARNCGIIDKYLMGSHGHIKIPIDFFIALDKEKKAKMERKEVKEETGKFLWKHIIQDPIDDVKTVATALNQKIVKNNFNAKQDIVNISSHKGLFFHNYSKSNRNPISECDLKISQHDEEVNKLRM